MSSSCADEMSCWCQGTEENGDDRKPALSQITIHYNQDIKNAISECTKACETLRQMGYSSKGPQQVPLLSAKNRKLRLKCCLVWWDSMAAATFTVRIWHQKNESLISRVQADGGVMVWEIFSWHTLGALIRTDCHLNCTAYLTIVADHVHPFMTTLCHLLMATPSRIMHHVTKLKSSQTV